MTKSARDDAGSVDRRKPEKTKRKNVKFIFKQEEKI